MESLETGSFRNSRMELNEVYFWTDTIKDWKKLLIQDKYKELIVNQLKWLKDRNKILIYGFVIIPNHLHIIWEMLESNGKEMPHASFNKWTGSNFLKDLRTNHPKVVPFFKERTTERSHRFWQRDPLAILMDSREKIEQKLDYLPRRQAGIHLNPLQQKWNLVEFPEDYRWSSAKFYNTGEDEFGILTHYMDRF